LSEGAAVGPKRERASTPLEAIWVERANQIPGYRKSIVLGRACKAGHAVEKPREFSLEIW
jgi:hypothetical protein